MVEKILGRSRDPRKIPRKTPQTPRHMREHGQLYIHTAPQAPLTKRPASKEAKSGNRIVILAAKPSRTTKTAS
ncbi:MAG: hypothetical protein RQ885_06280 [Desulfurococcales archaeon]|nr:hypothetical protein [Desulfurococcales archaeon]